MASEDDASAVQQEAECPSGSAQQAADLAVGRERSRSRSPDAAPGTPSVVETKIQSLEAGQRRLRDALNEHRAASLRWKRQAEAQSRSDRAALAWLRQRVVELQGQLDDVNRVLGEALERNAV